MKTKHQLPLVAVFAACISTCALADGSVIPGDTNAPEYLAHRFSELSGHGGRFTGTLIQACADYQVLQMRITTWEKAGWSDADLAEWRARREKARAAIVARVESHPQELNDVSQDHGWFYSPLWFAVSTNDVELVRLLLDKGAIPFLSEFRNWNGTGEGDVLFRLEGTKPEIIRMLHEARSQYNVLEIMLQAQKHGVELKERWPKRPAKEVRGSATAQP